MPSYQYLTPFVLIQPAHTMSKGYLEVEKPGLNDWFKDFWCTNTYQTKIWCGEFN